VTRPTLPVTKRRVTISARVLPQIARQLRAFAASRGISLGQALQALMEEHQDRPTPTTDGSGRPEGTS